MILYWEINDYAISANHKIPYFIYFLVPSYNLNLSRSPLTLKPLNYHPTNSPLFQKVIEFLNWVNVMQEQVGRPRVNPQAALKFLSARKFDVTRAITLFRNHEVRERGVGR